MIRNVKSAHQDILEGLPELKGLIPRPARNKQLLLEMARRGDPKPSKRTPLGEALSRYTKKSGRSHDPAFTDEIRGLAPHWFRPRTPARGSMDALREMAKRGDPRPSQKTYIGRSLSDYTSPSNKSYKKDFHREMKRIRPDWFTSQTEKAADKKRQLLDMARKGLPRPSHDRTRLGQALSNYTRKSSHVYDPEFDRNIRALRPDWFAL